MDGVSDRDSRRQPSRRKGTDDGKNSCRNGDRKRRQGDNDEHVISDGDDHDDKRRGEKRLKRSTSDCSMDNGGNHASVSSNGKGESNASASGGEEDGKPSSSSGSGTAKRDRSNLRKGKWTVEEEEYTSRIIHYFSTGLLTLPEGSTLRSFLAEKLNCDPMRITKKYAGASCLGRRAYQFRQRPQPSIAEIQFAKAELDLLEQRFRLRVEEGRPGIPLPTPNFASFAAAQNNQLASAATIQAMLLNLANNNANAAPTPAIGVPQAPAPFGLQQIPQSINPNFLLQSQAHAQNATNPLLQQMQAQLQTRTNSLLQTQPDANMNPMLSALGMQLSQNNNGLDNVLANLILAQAAASLHNNQRTAQPPAHSSGPIISLSAALGVPPAPAPTVSPPASVPPPPPPPVAAPMPLKAIAPTTSQLAPPASSSMNPADQLKAAFEEHLRSQNIPLPPKPEPPMNPVQRQTMAFGQSSAMNIAALANHSKMSPTPTAKQNQITQASTSSVRIKDDVTPAPASVARKEDSKGKASCDDDKDAGNLMMGFLSSLRDSYETALRNQESSHAGRGQDDASKTTSLAQPADRKLAANVARRKGPATVTDTSSQPTESSVEDSDWNSDKKTDPSSSEDSDRDDNKDVPMKFRKGPPRKRIKGMSKCKGKF